MKCYLMLFSFITFIIISCSPPHRDGNNTVARSENTEDIVDSINQYYLRCGLDSAVIEYYRSYDADCFIYNYSKGALSIKSIHTSFNKIITDKNVVNRFIRYVDVFFIAKTQKIHLVRLRSLDWIISDYPWLDYNLFVGDKQIHEKISMGEEGYDIEFNPLFLDFFNLLNEMVNSKRSFN